jgi:hypothetical protein
VLLHAAFNAVPLVTMIVVRQPIDASESAPLPLVPAGLSAVACVALLVALRHLSRHSSVARMARSRDA